MPELYRYSDANTHTDNLTLVQAGEFKRLQNGGKIERMADVRGSDRSGRRTGKRSPRRIHGITIKRMVDESPDTSWLGEYSNKPSSEYSIDRAHDLDCIANTGYASKYTKCRNCTLRQAQHETVWFETVPQLRCFVAEDMHDEQETFTPVECDCGRGDWHGREYRYFNPSFNYVDKHGHALKENTPEDVRKYVRQGYERMESLNRGDWHFIGIRAEAEYTIDGTVLQELPSGGLWGIESDSSADYFADVEKEELADLRAQLAGIGFSKRAITTAFRDITREDD